MRGYLNCLVSNLPKLPLSTSYSWRLVAQRGAHAAQQAFGAQCASCPSLHAGLKHRTAFSPGDLQVEGALSQ